MMEAVSPEPLAFQSVQGPGLTPDVTTTEANAARDFNAADPDEAHDSD